MAHLDLEGPALGGFQRVRIQEQLLRCARDQANAAPPCPASCESATPMTSVLSNLHARASPFPCPCHSTELCIESWHRGNNMSGDWHPHLSAACLAICKDADLHTATCCLGNLASSDSNCIALHSAHMQHDAAPCSHPSADWTRRETSSNTWAYAGKTCHLRRSCAGKSKATNYYIVYY